MHFNHAFKRLEDHSAIVAIRLQINQKGDEKIEDAPFWLEVEYTANFNWTDDMSNEEVDRYLSINSSAMLIGYIRPMVAALTSASPFPTYTIPFVNVNNMFK